MKRTLKSIIEGGLKLKSVRAALFLGATVLIATWLIDYVARTELRAIRDVIDADLSVDTVSISPFGSGVVIDNLSLARHGEVFFRCARIETPLHFSFEQWHFSLGRATILGAELHIHRMADGKLNVDGLFNPRADTTPPAIPPVLVSNGTILLKEHGFPTTMRFSEVQIKLESRGKSFNVEVLGSTAWLSEPPLCRHFGINGSLSSFDDLELRFLLSDVDCSRIPSSWVDNATLSGMALLKGRVERLAGTTVVTSDLETDALSLTPGEGAHYYKTWLRNYRGAFIVQAGKSPLRSHPQLPDGGGVAVDVTTRNGEIRLQLPDKRKTLDLVDPSFLLTVAGDKLTLKGIRGTILGSPLAARVNVLLADTPTFAATFSVAALAAKRLANLMPYSNFSLAGAVHLKGSVAGTFENPVLRTVVASEQLKVFVGTESRNIIFKAHELQANAQYDGRTLTLNSLTGTIGSTTPFSLAGNYEPENRDEVHLALSVSNLSFDEVAQIIDSPESPLQAAVKPSRPVDLSVSLDRDQLELSLATHENVLYIRDLPLATSSLVISARTTIPASGLPESLLTTATMELAAGGTISTTGVVPLISTAPLDMHARVEAVDLAVFTPFSPVTAIGGRGVVNAEVDITGRQGTHHVIAAKIRLPREGAVTIPVTKSGQPRRKTVAVRNLKGSLRLERSPDGNSLQIDDFVSSLRQDGRLSLSVKHTEQTSRTVTEAGFKMVNVAPQELLDFIDGRVVDATGRGEIAGSYKQNGDQQRVDLRLDFPKVTVIRKDEDKRYELPISEFSGRCSYEVTGTQARFVVPRFKATLFGGTFTMQGINQIAPIVKPNVRFLFDDFELKSFCNALGIEDFSARGSARAEGLVAGNIWWPRVSATITSPKPRLYWRVDDEAKYPIDLGATSGNIEFYRDKAGYLLELSRVQTTALDGSLAGEGTIRLEPDVTLDIQLSLARATAKKLASLLAIDDFSFAGTLNGQGRLVGPGRRPTFTADLRLDDARLFYQLRGINLFYHPPHVLGRLSLDKDRLELSDLRGPIHDGLFRFRIHRQRRQGVLWNASLHFEDVSLQSLFKANLTQKNDIVGRGFLDLFFQGKNSDAKTFTGRGTFRVQEGAIRALEELETIQKKYQLRNLIGIEFERLRASLKLMNERLTFSSVDVRSSKGHATGEVSVGFDTSLDGSLKVGLERNVLSSGHRLISLLEGGRYFDFRTRIAGTTDKPTFGFSAKGVHRGALLGGALLFSPVAPAAALIGGLQSLFGKKRRRHRAAPSTETTTSTTSP